MAQPTRKGEPRTAMVWVVVAVIMSGVVLAGTASAAASPAEWTVKDAGAAAKALGYPKPHARKTTCHGLGTAGAGGLYSGFKCRSVYLRGSRSFYLFDDTSGWVVAGSHETGAKQLRTGFVSAGEAKRLGGLGVIASNAATAYVQTHDNTFDPQSSGCSDSGPVWTCSFTTPATTVTIRYKGVKDGWTLRGTNS